MSYASTSEEGGSASISCVIKEILAGSHSLGGHCAKLTSSPSS